MGDPAGVGPELCLQAADHSEINSICLPLIYGSLDVLRRCSEKLKLDLNPERIVDVAASLESVQPGRVSAITGRASFQFVDLAIKDAQQHDVSAVVTGPINKAAWDLAGINYPGHTELFAERTGTREFCMLMASPKLSCSLVTCHVGLGSVAKLISRHRILEVIVLTYEAMKRMRGREPRLIVLGLNPHAGEGGRIGQAEEEEFIIPAIKAAQEKGIQVEGPLPPDTAFLPWKLETTDAHVCMYHDQGLIPFKALAFDSGINTTLGLPIVRTSVDHGTALDIAWQGKADPASMFEAVKAAVYLSSQPN